MGFDSMKVFITIIPTNEQTTLLLKDGSTIMELLKQIQYKPHATIVLHNNIPVPEDDIVIDGEEYQVIPVASGG
jgi:sulfur carrier protein ThiS